MSRGFIWGVVVGIGGTYVFHRFVKPIAGKKSN